jgi:hypothetical protein
LPRLVLDASRPVRLEVVRALGALAAGLGRAFAPHFKSVAGPWWLAAHDGAADVSCAAAAGWAASFPTPAKTDAALSFARSDILAALGAAARARPADLGWDAAAEAGGDPGDLAERADRARTGALRAGAALVARLAEAGSQAPPGALEDVAGSLVDLLVGGGGCGEGAGGEGCTPATSTTPSAAPSTTSRAAKKSAARAAAAAAAETAIDHAGGKQQRRKPLLVTALASASPTVRAAASRCVAALAAAAPSVVVKAAPSLGPPILRSLGERDASAQGSAWDAALRLTALPGGGGAAAWAALGDARAGVLPALAWTLSHPLPASPAARGLLPLLATAPTAVLLPDGIKSLCVLLDAAWSGVVNGGAGAPAAAAAFREAARWGLAAHVGVLAADGGSVADALVGPTSPLGTRVLPAALGGGEGAAAALDAASAAVSDAVRPGACPQAWPALLASLAGAGVAALADALAGRRSPATFQAVGALMAAVDEASASGAASRALPGQGADALASALAAPLVSSLSAAAASDAPPAAATLLAALIERHPAAVAGVSEGGGPASVAATSAPEPPPAGLSLSAAADALASAPPGVGADGWADVVLACARAGGEAGASEWRATVRGWAAKPSAFPALAALLASLSSAATDAGSPGWRGKEVDEAAGTLTAAVIGGAATAVAPLSALLDGAGGAPLVGEHALGAVLAALAASLDARRGPSTVVPVLESSLLAILTVAGTGGMRPGAGSAAAALMAAAAAEGCKPPATPRARVVAAGRPWPSSPPPAPGDGGEIDSASSWSATSSVAAADSLSDTSEEDAEGGGSSSSSDGAGEATTTTTTTAAAAAAAWARGRLVCTPALAPDVRSALASALLDRALMDADSGAATPAATAAAVADAARVGAGGGDLSAAGAGDTLDAALAVSDGPVPLVAALVAELGPELALTRASGAIRSAEAAALLVDGSSSGRAAARAVLRWARAPSTPPAVGGAILASLLQGGGGVEATTPFAAAAAAHLIKGGVARGGGADAAVRAAWAGAVREALTSPLTTLPPRLAAALPAAAVAFRGTGAGDGAVEASALPALAGAALSAAAALPTLAQAKGQAEDKLSAVACLLSTAAACYPPGSTAPGVATPVEQAALATALERQLAGERAAAAAAAVAARLGGAEVAERVQPDAAAAAGGSGAPGASPAAAPSADGDADAALASLAAATLQYASSSIPAPSWPDVIRRVRAGVGGATAGVEAAAEAATCAAVGAARTLAGPAGADAAPTDALEMLRRLSAGGGPAATMAAARAAGPVAGALTELTPGGGGGGQGSAAAAEAWAACFASLDARFSSSTSPPPPSSWRAARADALADAARAGLALGVVDAAAAAAGGGAPAAAAAWAAARPGLAALGATGLAAAATDPDPALATAAAEEADGWGEGETGVDAAGAALATALRGCGGPPARRAALTLLTRPDGGGGLARKLVEPVIPGEDDEGGAWGGGDGGSSSEEEARGTAGGCVASSRAALEAAGVRADLAAALISPPLPQTAPVLPLLAAWAVVLARLEGLPPGSPARSALGQALHECVEGGVGRLLDCVAGLLQLDGHGGGGRGEGRGGRRVAALPAAPAAAAAAAAAARAAGRTADAAWTLPSALAALPPLPPHASPQAEAAPLAAPLFRAALRATPASARLWFASLRHRGLAAAVERYTASLESATIIAGELAGAASVGPGSGADAVPGWAVRTAPGAREAVASLTVEDGAALELALTLPPSWPLRPAAVSVRRAVGVPDARLRRWMLAIAAFLRAQNGGLAGGVRLWRANVAKEFAGLEECLICYAIVAAGAEGGGGGGLPRKACRTCGKRFHGGCLYKWFRSSAKAAACPHCQAEWGV